MFLFIKLIIVSLIILSKDLPGTCRVFHSGKVLWTLTSDKEAWVTSGDIDWTIFYEAKSQNRLYYDEVWCLKCNGKLQIKRLLETCWRQVKEQKTNFPNRYWE